MIASLAVSTFFAILASYRWIDTTADMRTLALIAILASQLASQEIDSHSVVPPVIQLKIQPEYTDEARQARLEGTATVSVTVGADGKPRDLKILRSLGLGLDESALAAVGKWQFRPATKNGEPVDSKTQIELNFRLLDTLQVPWHLSRVEFHFPRGVARPVVQQVVAPHIAADAGNADAIVTFDLNEKGGPFNIRVDKSSGQPSGDDWSRDVTTAIAQWKFSPGTLNGHPVAVSCTLEFVRGQ
jgi:TonB family protein